MTRRTGKSCGCPRQAGAAPGTGSECPLLLSMLSGHCVEDYVGPRSRAPSARPRPPACGPAVPLPRASSRGGGRGTDQRPARTAPAPLLGGLQGSGPAGQRGPGTSRLCSQRDRARGHGTRPGPRTPGRPTPKPPDQIWTPDSGALGPRDSPTLPTSTPPDRFPDLSRLSQPQTAPPARDPHPWDPESPGPLPAQPERLDPRIPDPGPEPDPLTPETLP